jgi:hypothetical protein
MAPSNKSILQRIEEAEVKIQGLTGLGAATQNIQAAQRQTLGILAALIQEVGETLLGEQGGEKLDRKIHERLLEQQRQFVQGKIADQRRTLQALIDAGQIVPGQAVTENSILVLQESLVTKTGEGEAAVETKKVQQEYLQMHIAQLFQENQKIGEELVGKSVGYEFRDGDYELKVLALYEPKTVSPLTESSGEAEVPPAPAPTTDTTELPVVESEVKEPA